MANKIEIIKTSITANGASKLLIFILIISTLLSSCSSNSHDHHNNAKSYNTVNWVKNNFEQYNNEALDSYLNNLIQRLEISARRQYKNLPQSSWKVHVIESNQHNAFFAGNSNIIITKNLILNSNNESTLAAIIAHEMAHNYLKHQSINKKNEMQADSLAANIIEVAGFRADSTLNALNILYRIKEEKVSNSLDSRRANLAKVLKNKVVWGIVDSREYREIVRRIR